MQMEQIKTLEQIEKEHIIHSAIKLNGNKVQMAKVLGISLKTMYNKLHNYNLINQVNEIFKHHLNKDKTI
jgi:transcriptional regulator of acetoin/glycerol metabolism